MDNTAVTAPMNSAPIARRGARRLASLEDAEAVSNAAKAGEPDAMRLVAMLLAKGVGAPSDWNAALAWQLAAAEAGDQDARAELIVMSADEDHLAHLAGLAARAESFADETWRKLAEGVDWRQWLVPPIPKLDFEKPVIATARGFATPRFCRWAIERSHMRLERATVVVGHAESALVDEARTNSVAATPFVWAGLPLLALRERIARMVNLPLANFEMTNFLHYLPGQEFKPHYDSFDPNGTFKNEDFRRQGQRTATLLVYLNDEYEGGETIFPYLDWQFRGEVGDALFWRNVLPGGGQDPATLHAGTPPTSGEKWVLSQWIRDLPQPEFI